ncbi:MAG: hypothetical protein E6Q61_04310 [Nitrosomonas sp.]|nr:MAG: hypothetical protein E6Q61_04310 [Nitrosomonas sp.]
MAEYNDKFLAPLATPERELAAKEYIESIGTIPEPWKARLIVLRTYIIICNESLKGTPDDIFSAKLKTYRQEYADAVERGRDAAIRANTPQTTILPEQTYSVTFGRD